MPSGVTKGELSMSLLSAEIRTLANSLLSLSDNALRQQWPASPGRDGWESYSDNLSDIMFLLYQRLCDFTVMVQCRRVANGPKITEAQRILAQHQGAYRDFHGAMAGVRDEELDLTPFEKKWSLRSNLAHLMLAECWSQGPQVLHAVQQHRAGREVSPMLPRNSGDERGAPVDYGSVADLLTRFDRYHNGLVDSLLGITDDELNASSVYWEGGPVAVRFRLYRFAWHIRSHIMQTEKIRVEIGHRPTDIDRFVRLLYSALGHAEGALVGAGDSQHELERDFVESIHVRVQEVDAIAQSLSLPQ